MIAATNHVVLEALAPHASAAIEPTLKQFATLQARAALRGDRVDAEVGIDGRTTYRVHHLGRVRTVSSLPEIEAMLERSRI